VPPPLFEPPDAIPVSSPQREIEAVAPVGPPSPCQQREQVPSSFLTPVLIPTAAPSVLTPPVCPGSLPVPRVWDRPSHNCTMPLHWGVNKSHSGRPGCCHHAHFASMPQALNHDQTPIQHVFQPSSCSAQQTSDRTHSVGMQP
jgi:hypothetical protein